MKYCEQDPIPSKLFVQCFEELKTIVLYIVNESLRSGVFPTALKNAYVRPSIKELGANLNEYSSYRPISNLPFLSKVVHKQLEFHLRSNQLHADIKVDIVLTTVVKLQLLQCTMTSYASVTLKTKLCCSY